jgi:hypothetical protein
VFARTSGLFLLGAQRLKNTLTPVRVSAFVDAKLPYPKKMPRNSRSQTGAAASIVFLLLLPIAIAYQALFDQGVEIVIHVVLAIGSALLSVAVFDFKTPRWITWITSISTGILAAIFLLQAVSLAVPDNGALSYVAFRSLGQEIEGWLGNLFIIWCAVMLLTDSRGKTRVFGFVAVGLVICEKVYEHISRYRGETVPDAAKLLIMLVIWLLLVSRKKVTS